MPRPTGLGHVGIHVNDLPRMKEFYTRVLGLTVTDESEERGMVFLSARPEQEHHELLLAAGRTAPPGLVYLNQISFHAASLEDLQEYLRLFREEGVVIEQVVTHGIAFGIYFLDPEGNRLEVYWSTDVKATQPYRKDINLEQTRDAVLAEAERLLADTSTPSYNRVTA